MKIMIERFVAAIYLIFFGAKFVFSEDATPLYDQVYIESQFFSDGKQLAAPHISARLGKEACMATETKMVLIGTTNTVGFSLHITPTLTNGVLLLQGYVDISRNISNNLVAGIDTQIAHFRSDKYIFRAALAETNDICAISNDKDQQVARFKVTRILKKHVNSKRMP